MKLKQCLINGRICGLDTVIEAVNQFFRFRDVIPFNEFDDQERELYEDLATSGAEDDELIVDVLKNKYQVDIIALDGELYKDLDESNKKQFPQEYYFNRVVEKINTSKYIEVYDKYFDCGEYLLRVYWDMEQASWVYETVYKVTQVHNIEEFLAKEELRIV